MKKKSIINKTFLNIAILTTSTVVIWIIFDVYHSLHKPIIPEVLKKQLEPINPTIDKNTLEELKQRRFIDEQELEKIPKTVTFETEEGGEIQKELKETQAATTSAQSSEAGLP